MFSGCESTGFLGGNGAVVQSPVKVSFKNKHLLQREYGHPRENVAAIVCNFNAHD